MALNASRHALRLATGAGRRQMSAEATHFGKMEHEAAHAAGEYPPDSGLVVLRPWCPLAVCRLSLGPSHSLVVCRVALGVALPTPFSVTKVRRGRGGGGTCGHMLVAISLHFGTHFPPGAEAKPDPKSTRLFAPVSNKSLSVLVHAPTRCHRHLEEDLALPLRPGPGCRHLQDVCPGRPPAADGVPPLCPPQATQEGGRRLCCCARPCGVAHTSSRPAPLSLVVAVTRLSGCLIRRGPPLQPWRRRHHLCSRLLPFPASFVSRCPFVAPLTFFARTRPCHLHPPPA